MIAPYKSTIKTDKGKLVMEKDKKGKVTATYKLNGVQMWKINKVIGIGEKEH